jgi:hypothetical protein
MPIAGLFARTVRLVPANFKAANASIEPVSTTRQIPMQDARRTGDAQPRRAPAAGTQIKLGSIGNGGKDTAAKEKHKRCFMQK